MLQIGSQRISTCALQILDMKGKSPSSLTFGTDKAWCDLTKYCVASSLKGLWSSDFQPLVTNGLSVKISLWNILSKRFQIEGLRLIHRVVANLCKKLGNLVIWCAAVTLLALDPFSTFPVSLSTLMLSCKVEKVNVFTLNRERMHICVCFKSCLNWAADLPP